MIWTTETPTKPGVYWFRPNQSWEPSLRRIYLYQETLMYETWGGGNGLLNNCEYPGKEDQWAGPVEPPLQGQSR